jgi:putative hemolysin
MMDLIFVGAALVLSAVFNGFETGFISINRVRLHARLEDGNRGARILERLSRKSENVIGVLLLGISLTDIASVIYFTNYLNGILGHDQLIPLYVTLILTPVILIFSTLLPKILFREFADSLMHFFCYPLFFFYILLYPFQFLFVKIVKVILSILGLKKRKSMFSKDEFNTVLDMSAEKGTLKESEREFIESIMKFKDIRAKEIMIPLIRMTCVEENDTVEIASALMLTTKHSRLPVFRMRVDNMIGYVENKELLDANKHDRIGKYVKETVFVPDLMPINQVLVRMQGHMAQMSFVVDEYGGVAGIITNQDIIAEILGGFVEIREELFQKEGDDYMANGILNIDELNEELNLKIKKMDFETVAGFVLYKLGRIPAEGDSFEEGKYTFEVVSANNTRIKKVKISRKRKKDKKRSEKKNAV